MSALADEFKFSRLEKMSDNQLEKQGRSFLCEKEIIDWEHDDAVERVSALGSIVKANGRDFARELFHCT